MVVQFEGSIEDTECKNYIVLLDCMLKDGQYENSESMYVHNLCDTVNDRRVGTGRLHYKERLNLNGCVSYNPSDIDDKWFIGVYCIDPIKRKMKNKMDYIDYKMLHKQLSWIKGYLEGKNESAAICMKSGDFFYSNTDNIRMIITDVFRNSSIDIYFCKKEIMI